MAKSHWEITHRELCEFIDSLDSERESFRIPKEELLKSNVVIGGRFGGEVCGLAGIRRKFLLPVLFIVVRRESQGKGVGSDLLQRLNRLASDRYKLIMLTVSKKNPRARDLFTRYGYRPVYEKGDSVIMARPTDGTGLFLYKAIRLITLPVSALAGDSHECDTDSRK